MSPDQLSRSAEHANHCHQAELRRAVAMTTGTRLADVIVVQLVDLRADGVCVRWVDSGGGHTRELAFPRAAATLEELGDLLRTQLHAGLC